TAPGVACCSSRMPTHPGDAIEWVPGCPGTLECAPPVEDGDSRLMWHASAARLAWTLATWTAHAYGQVRDRPSRGDLSRTAFRLDGCRERPRNPAVSVPQAFQGVEKGRTSEFRPSDRSDSCTKSCGNASGTPWERFRSAPLLIDSIHLYDCYWTGLL